MRANFAPWQFPLSAFVIYCHAISSSGNSSVPAPPEPPGRNPPLPSLHNPHRPLPPPPACRCSSSNLQSNLLVPARFLNKNSIVSNSWPFHSAQLFALVLKRCQKWTSSEHLDCAVGGEGSESGKEGGEKKKRERKKTRKNNHGGVDIAACTVFTLTLRSSVSSSSTPWWARGYDNGEKEARGWSRVVDTQTRTICSRGNVVGHQAHSFFCFFLFLSLSLPLTTRRRVGNKMRSDKMRFEDVWCTTCAKNSETLTDEKVSEKEKLNKL